MKNTLFFFILTFASLIHADSFEDPQFINLENSTLNFLKNSWCSEEKAKLILRHVVTHRPSVCVEIGGFTGSSALPMLLGLQYCGSGVGYVVDAWSNVEAVNGLPLDDPNAIWWSQINMAEIKRAFHHTITQWSLAPYTKVLHMTSASAAPLIPMIDFLHLDGSFSESGALLDAELYLPKVVDGGYILVSNILTMIGKKASKMKSLWSFFEYCEIENELENGNVLLFKKIGGNCE